MPRKKAAWKPPREFFDVMPKGRSGNTVNGLGETGKRRPSPFFWHEPKYQEFGDVQAYFYRTAYRDQHAKPIMEAIGVNPDGTFRQRGPSPIPQAETKVENAPEEWSRRVKEFVLANDGDMVGIAEVDPLWVYEGFEIEERYVVMIGVDHNHEELSQVAIHEAGDVRTAIEVGRQYTRGAVASAKLLNFIRSQGYKATAYGGPTPTALNMIPAAIAAGLGELGKHGSMINRKYGSAFRLAAVTTDMPLVVDRPDRFGADDFCISCNVCSNACPPDAIFREKQTVRGEVKWYVDFDACIPYFAKARGCGICIAVCPWSRPGIAENLLGKMAKRRAGESNDVD